MLTTPEVVAPRADAVSLVHSDAGDLLPPGQGLQHLPDIGHDNNEKICKDSRVCEGNIIYVCYLMCIDSVMFVDDMVCI